MFEGFTTWGAILTGGRFTLPPISLLTAVGGCGLYACICTGAEPKDRGEVSFEFEFAL